jgi:putative NADH-flavin reductase
LAVEAQAGTLIVKELQQEIVEALVVVAEAMAVQAVHLEEQRHKDLVQDMSDMEMLEETDLVMVQVAQVVVEAEQVLLDKALLLTHLEMQ